MGTLPVIRRFSRRIQGKGRRFWIARINRAMTVEEQVLDCPAKPDNDNEDAGQ
jgi:hypothetical protein